MKKSLTSFVLTIIMICGISIPASANNFETNNLTLNPIDETITIAAEESDAFLPISEKLEVIGDGEEMMRAVVQSSVRVVENHIYPIVLCVETNEAFILNNIKRSEYRYNLAGQAESLSLSSAAVNAFILEALTALANDAGTAQYTWAVVGWRVENVIELAADSPRRLEWTPSVTCLEGTELRSLAIPYQSAKVNIGHNYGLPANPDKYYFVGISGAFYFKFTTGNNTGKEGTVYVSSGAMMN